MPGTTATGLAVGAAALESGKRDLAYF